MDSGTGPGVDHSDDVSDVPWNAPYYEKLGFHVVSTLTPALQALVDEQATWGLDPSLRVVMRRPLVDQTH